MSTRTITRLACGMVFAVFVLGFATMATAGVFTNAQQVNLLERWNTNGTYALGVANSTFTGVDPRRALVYHMPGAGWAGAFGSANGEATDDIFVKFTFDSPKTIDTVSWQLRDNEAPKHMQVLDDTNTVILDVNVAPAFLDGTKQTYALGGPVTTSSIEFRAPDAQTASAFFHSIHFGAYLAPSESLAMDGTYNVFYEENPAPTGFNSALWTNRVSDRLNPGNANATTWQFGKNYQFTGAFLTHENDSFNLNDAKIEVSSDGVSWQTAYGPTSFGTGYMVFSQPLWGRYARLSWSDSGSGGGREINEFQLFAYLPEPSSALVMFGAMALLARRQRRGDAKAVVAA